MDSYVGRMLALLDSLGIDDKTAIMFSSDNGPVSPTYVDPEFFGSSGPLRGYKGTLYEGGIRVPFVVRWPGHVEAGTVSDHIGYFPDIMPTLAEMAGQDPPAGTDGISLLPTLLGSPDRQRQHDYLYWELPTDRGWVAVRKGDWKAVIRGVTDAFAFSRPQLFDLTNDIGESTDVARSQRETVSEMLDIMRQAHTRPEISDFELVPADRRR
jgi:arylsulfatase A-like enzyme